jgi:phenylacetate-CoA ligase
MKTDLLQRFPLLTDSSLSTLRRLEEHPHAPRYTHPGYNRVTQQGLENAVAFTAELENAPPRWTPDSIPDWIPSFLADCFRNVPFYRRWESPQLPFTELPTSFRADLNREPWAFVPDEVSLDDLVVYNTSGTTGHPLSILTHPDTLTLTLPLLKMMLRIYGIAWEQTSEQTAIAYISFQKQTYTYATYSPLLNDAGIVKINLHPSQWRNPTDAALFLNDLQPQVYTGTPLAFAELAKLPITATPLALVSTSMALNEGLRTMLEMRFNCPVIDMYSMNESGAIAIRSDLRGRKQREDPEGLAYTLLQPRLFVETLDTEGNPTPPGQRGEITLTGGFNRFLPLLRYRTGDYAALHYEGDVPYLVGLEGRPPVLFRALDGHLINNIDVSISLRPYTIAQYHLHQFADGTLRLRLRDSAVDEDIIRDVLLGLFGMHQPLTIEPLVEEGKVIQYTSEVE